MAHALSLMGKDHTVDVAVGLFNGTCIISNRKNRAVDIADGLFNGTCIISNRKRLHC
jgi:hypothetical protein